jgi:DNA-binding CsgD family transcriptional regulator
MKPEESIYPAWNMDGDELAVAIEAIGGDPVRFRIYRERKGRKKMMRPWTDVAELNIIPQDRTPSSLAELIIDRYDLIGEDQHNSDAIAVNVRKLVGKGLSKNEATVYAKVEAHHKVRDIAEQLGISQQAVSNVIRQARGKLGEKE